MIASWCHKDLFLDCNNEILYPYVKHMKGSQSHSFLGEIIRLLFLGLHHASLFKLQIQFSGYLDGE